jgi:hypothetical protein
MHLDGELRGRYIWNSLEVQRVEGFSVVFKIVEGKPTNEK